MTRQRLCIHIGYHKTGSTSVQSYLEENRELLMEKGLFYPETKRDDRRAYYNKHLHLFDQMVALKRDAEDYQDRMRAIFAPYIAEIKEAGCPISLLSEESFSGMGPHIVEALGFLREDFDVQIIAVLRRQDTFLQSWYHQSIKDFRETRNFSQFLTSTNWWRLHYDQVLDHWAEVFGAENLILRSYDLMTADPDAAILSDFLELVLGQRPDWPIKERVWNSSISSICYEMLKFAAREQMQDPEFRRLIQVQRKALSQLPALQRDELFQREYLNRNIRDVIHDWFGESNRITSEKYFGGADIFPGFQSSDTAPGALVDEPPSGAFLPREVVTAMARILLGFSD